MSAPLALPDGLAAQLAQFDDDAWIALASRGLLRRALKDLETQQPELVPGASADPATVVVNMGGQRVRFDARGPAQASCGCPAAGVCQHILAAAIGLQRMAAATLAAPAAQPAAPAELLALPAEALMAHAGRTGYRWAWQYVQGLDPQGGVTVSAGPSLVVAFRHPRITLRYMGGGLPAMIADTATPHLARMQVAAALAFRRLNGVADAPPAAHPTAPRAAPIGSAARRPTAQGARDDSRTRLLAAVCAAAGESLVLGLSHLSGATQQRFTTLSVWAQGAECYRLALMLRRIADHVEALLARSAGADEGRLLEELALGCALARALQSAGEHPPQYLLGRARSSYQGGRTLELLGLGAHAWRTAAGYTGLTMLFWCESSQGFVACTEARPELQRGFNPLARYVAPGPWQGLHAPAAATGRTVRLVNPQLNGMGRLAPSERTSASVETAPGLASRLPARARWADIAAERSQRGRRLLAEPDPMRDWYVLAPQRWGTPAFDAARQTLCWPVYDAEDAALVMELPYSTFNAAAIAQVELRAAGMAPGTLLVARLGDTAAGLAGEPLSLVSPDSDSLAPVACLHFPGGAAVQAGPAPSGPPSPAGSADGREPALVEDVEADPAHAPVLHNTPGLQPVREFRRWLARQAERGLQAHRLPAFSQEYRAHSAQLAGLGYTLFQQEGPAGPESLLRACYLCMQLDKLAQTG